MKTWSSTVWPTIGVALCLALPARGDAAAFGTLSNFDVVNDTSGPCHGFEIELEDIHPEDVPYTFGGSYTRYGAPEVLDVTADPAHPRVLVRYRKWNGSAWEATPIAPPNVSPGGHDCFEGGPVGNYQSSGCEHYGVSLSATPSRTTYRWIVAADPSDVASAFSAVPQAVEIPVPVWSVNPLPVDRGGGVNIRAELEPVEEEVHAQHGEPQWMKVFKIETELDLVPEDLVRLLLGVQGGILPAETEIETEWKLIQSKPGDAEEQDEDADIKEDPLDDGKHSVVRRYEFYHYTGPRDPENNEALPCIDGDQPVPANAPVEGCSDLGDFVGAQNVAVDVDLTAIDSELPAGEVDRRYEEIALLIGGLPPYTVTVTSGQLPPGLMIDGATGVLSGEPTAGGDFTFSVHAEDSASDAVDASFGIAIAGGAEPTATATPPATETPAATATATASPDVTATATPTGAAERCAGDCRGDGAVSVDELITLVNIALGAQPAGACAAGVPDGVSIDIALLVGAVGNALTGCPN